MRGVLCVARARAWLGREGRRRDARPPHLLDRRRLLSPAPSLPTPLKQPQGEYIDDTEDYINIELDYSRNRLLRLEILITVATFCLALYNLLAGVLVENLVLPEAVTRDVRGFALVNGTASAACVTLFFVAWRAMARLKMI